MILSCVTAYELMQFTLNYIIFRHFIVHLVLEHIKNVATWLSAERSYFTDCMTATVPNIHVDIDFDTNRPLISNLYLKSSITTPNVS